MAGDPMDPPIERSGLSVQSQCPTSVAGTEHHLTMDDDRLGSAGKQQVID